MTAWDTGCYVLGMGLVTAFMDAATGWQITRALRKVLRGKTPHLRGRKPAECGVGTVSAEEARRWVDEVGRDVRRLSSDVDALEARSKARGVELEGMANAWQTEVMGMRSWLDSALEAHTAPQPESFAEHQRRRAQGR